MGLGMKRLNGFTVAAVLTAAICSVSLELIESGWKEAT
jgi:hypothetical protein